MENKSQQLKQELRKVGLKATPARLAVFGVLQSLARPLNAKAIIGRLQPGLMDQATVYRSLGSLAEAGLIREINFQSGSYEVTSLPHHHHVICEQCGYLEDVGRCHVSMKSVGKSFAQVTDHSLEFAGVCNKCAKKNIYSSK